MATQYVALRALHRSANITVLEAYNRYVLTVRAGAGQFKLTVSNQVAGASNTTADLAYNISAANLKTALAGLTTDPDITTSNVNVTGGPGSASGSAPYYIAFYGSAVDQDFIITPINGTTPLSAGTGSTSATVSVTGRRTRLSATADTVVDLAHPSNQRALNKHSAVGQFIVTATNPDIAGNALPANS